MDNEQMPNAGNPDEAKNSETTAAQADAAPKGTSEGASEGTSEGASEGTSEGASRNQPSREDAPERSQSLGRDDASQGPGPGRGRGKGKRGGGGGGGGREGGGGRRGGGRDGGGDRQESEWEEKIIQVRRVTKVVKGGKKLSFRAVVAVGNGKGQVGVGIGKASEVIMAIQKGIADARKSLINVPLIKTTIPHEIVGRQGSSRVLLKPAAKGTGVIAGGATRAVLELAGIGDVMSKSLGSRSPLNVARATVNGLHDLRTFEQAARLRGITVKQMLS